MSNTGVSKKSRRGEAADSSCQLRIALPGTVNACFYSQDLRASDSATKILSPPKSLKFNNY